MKKILFLLLFTISLSASTGMKTLTNTTVDSLEHSGILTLKSVNIPGNLTGSGSLSASECTFGSIKWTGATHLATCRILRNSTLTGSLLAAHSTFERNVTVTSNYVELDGGVIKGDLIIQPTSNPKEEQTLLLSGAALIKGNVKFLSGNGILKKTDRAEVQGQVTGLKD